MARSARTVLLLTVVMAAVLASYTIDVPAGSWDLQTNYTAWASTITIRARDQI
jgi:hypothetical protein